MKKILIIFAIFLSSAVTAIGAMRMNTDMSLKVNSAVAQKGTANGLVGHWTFNGSDISGTQAYDKSGQGNNGTMTGTTKTLGKLGQGLSFNGTSDYVAATGYQHTIFTASAWIKLTSTGNYQGIVEYTDSSNIRYGLGINSADGKPFVSYNSSGRKFKISQSDVVTDGKWHFVVGGYNGTNAFIYVDGKIQTLGTETPPGLGTITSSLRIGDLGIPTYKARGTLDDVRVYNRALSAAEVKKLYSGGTVTANASQNTKLTSGLVGLWSFDGPDITDKVYDRSGQGNHGYFIGGATSTAKTAGKIGQGLRFNGTSDYVKLPASAVPTSFPITLAGWVYFNTSQSAGDYDYFIHVGEFGGGNSLAMIARNAVDHRYYYVDTGPVQKFGPVLPTGVWIHIATVFTGTTVSLYINGVSQTVEQPGGTMTIVPGKAAIGRITSSAISSHYLKGKADDVRVYNRALSASEIYQLYKLGK